MGPSNAELQLVNQSTPQREGTSQHGDLRPLRTGHLQPVILCGGSGTRLWPMSREQYPKQLLTLAGEHSMLQATARRVVPSSVAPDWRILSPIVVANEEYRFVTAEQLRRIDIKPAAIVLEPVGRNTAPALTLAALATENAGDDPVLVVMPADHVIGDSEAFSLAIAVGAIHAGAGRCAACGRGWCQGNCRVCRKTGGCGRGPVCHLGRLLLELRDFHGAGDDLAVDD